MKKIDESILAFEEYKTNHVTYSQSDLSESDTRSKLIDSLLINVLGWSEQDMLREGHVESGYYDYKVSLPGTHFIVEAKRKFNELKLPSNHKRASIKSLLKGNEEVFTQIRSYAIDESIPYGVITNGYQFVIMKVSNTDNTPWKENSCLIFNGLEDIENRFIEFYDNLSKYSIVNNGGFKFDLPIANIEFKTILSTLTNKDSELIRNSLSAKVTPLIDTVFGEVFSEEREDDIEFIKYCFIQNEETKKNKSEIERLFGDYAPKLGNVIPAVNSKNIANQISKEIVDDEISNKNNYPPKPIIIIGSKGAGKTTFINHLFKYSLQDKNEQDENHFIIYVDFRKFFQIDSDFKPEIVIDDILEKLYTKYEEVELHSLNVLKRIYYKEIKRNDESIWLYEKAHDETAYNNSLAKFLEESKKDRIHHLELLSKYLIRERRKRLIVIIDNADQYSLSIQKKLFVFAHSLTKTTLCGTVISLREGYYYKWQNSPPFDAYESNVYHITAPNYGDVLQKRIEFALKKIAVKDAKIKGSENKGNITWEVSNEDVYQFLAGLKNSLFSPKNTKIIDFLNHTTYPNIREGLRVFKSFLTSGHTQISEYIIRERYRIESEKVHQTIPFHEFFKSIGLQNRVFYNSESSIIYNIFTPPIDSIDHFIKLYILMELNEVIEKRSYTERRIPNTLIVDKFHSLGYRTNVINASIFSLIKYSLIDTDELLSDVDWNELPPNFNMSLTGKGHYYLKELIGRFHYYDLILHDTPIFDINEFNTIRASFPLVDAEGRRNLSKRVEVVKLFLEYFKSMEHKQAPQVLRAYGAFFNGVIKQAEKENTEIIASIHASK